MTTRKYLVVDDNKEFAENVAEILTDAGADVSLELGGSGALARLGSTRFDGVVTDMRMPDCSGAELVRRVRDLDPGVPVVLLSAYANDAEVDEARRYGLLACLSKPAGTQRLLELLPRARRDATILLVEDDVAFADGLSEALTSRGFSVCTSHSLAELETVQVKPLAAIVDLRIPKEIDGASLRMVRERYPGIPILVVTGLQGAAAHVEGLQCFAKPFRVEQLLSRLEALASSGRAS